MYIYVVCMCVMGYVCGYVGGCMYVSWVGDYKE